MPQAAVDDVDLLDALFQRLEAALDLGDHAGRYRAVGDQSTSFGGGEVRDQALEIGDVAEHARDVGEHDELFGPDAGGHGRRCGVGVDVELLAIGPHGHRGNHRHLAGVHEVVNREPVDTVDLADMAEVDRLPVGAVEREPLTEQDVGREKVERHRPAAELLELGDQVVVEFGGEHLLHDGECGVVCVAATLHPLRLDAGLVHRPADGLAATVDNHDPHAERRQKHDVEQQVAEGVGMFKDAAAELDDGGRVAELANPAKRFDERVGLLDRLLLGLGYGRSGGHVANGPS